MMSGRQSQDLAPEPGGIYGWQLCGTGGGGYGVWDSDGGDVHVLSGAQAAQRGAAGSACPRRGSADAAGALGGGTIQEVWNFAGGGGTGVHRDFHSYWTRGSRCDDCGCVWGDSFGDRTWLLCRSRADSARRESTIGWE